jgi:hypothetical protein
MEFIYRYTRYPRMWFWRGVLELKSQCPSTSTTTGKVLRYQYYLSTVTTTGIMVVVVLTTDSSTEYYRYQPARGPSSHIP